MRDGASFDRRIQVSPGKEQVTMRSAQERGDSFRLALLQTIHNASLQIEFDPFDHYLWCDHVHATRQTRNDVHAPVLFPVQLVAVAQRNDPRAPTASGRATRQRPDGMDELVSG